MWCHILVFGMPVLGLGLFSVLPWEQALPLYGGIVLVSVILYRETARALRLQVQTGREGMVGMQGLALTNIRSEGLIRIRGETWKAAATEPITKGEAVRVVRVDGIRAVVERGAGPTPEGKRDDADEGPKDGLVVDESHGICRNGRTREKYVGAKDRRKPETWKLLEALLNEP